MIKKPAFFVLIFFLSLTLLPNTAYGQSTDSATLETKPSSVRERMAAEKQKLQENREEIRASKEAAIKEKREDLMEKIQQKRAEAQQKFQAKRAALQQKIASIKDEKKRQLVERIDNKLSTVNNNRTNQMTQNAEKLSNILDDIKEKASTAKENGKNTNTVDTAITKAETAIQNAKTAVQTQASKEYVITITATGSGQLKSSIGATTKQLQADLSTSHKLLVAAKQAVQQAHMELSKVLGIPVAPTSTSSATVATP